MSKNKQHTCDQCDQNDHSFERYQHSTGNYYLDGRAQCTNCGLQKSDVLPIQPESQIASTTLSSEKEYPTLHDWRNEHGKAIYLQGGDSGIVLSKNKPYRTAFFEAFPTIHGYSTFIRGEGQNIKEAEEDAWKKYQTQLACVQHNFTRTYRGKHRTDGFGQCINCNMTSSEALPPETLCEIYKTPTNNKFKGVFLSYQAFYEIPFVEILDDFVSSIEDDEEANSDITDLYFIYNLHRVAFKIISDESAYVKLKSKIDHVISYIIRLYKHIELQVKNMFDIRNLPKIEDQQNLHLWISTISSSNLFNQTVISFLKNEDPPKIAYEQIISIVRQHQSNLRDKQNA